LTNSYLQTLKQDKALFLLIALLLVILKYTIFATLN